MRMNIAIATNKKYVDYAGVMLKSLACHHREDELQVYVLNNQLLQEDFIRMHKIVSADNVFLKDIKIDRGYFEDERLPVTESWTIEVYFRLLITEVLPKELDRVLYLDVDIIINRPLYQLYHHEMENYDFVVCKDVAPLEWQKKRRNELFAEQFAAGYQYFNAGVMLWNLNRLRHGMRFYDYMAQLKKWDYNVTAVDQDLLNYIYWETVCYADESVYNYLAREGHKAGEGYEFVKENAAIIHFVGDKPWSTGCIHFDIEQLWWDYAERTPIYAELLEQFQKNTMTDDRLERYVEKTKQLNQKLLDAVNSQSKPEQEREIVYLYSQEEPEGASLSFLELLLDENRIGAQVFISKETYKKTGGINSHLKAKQLYELLLRASEYADFTYTRRTDFAGETWLCLSEEGSNEEINDSVAACIQTDAYVIGKYSRMLREENYFDAAVNGILTEAEQCSVEILPFLEDMIGKREKYEWMEEGSGAILIYCGDMACYGVLDEFARSFGRALERQGQTVVYFDLGKKDPQDVAELVKQNYKAVVGFQSYMFSVEKEDNTLIHNDIRGEKYNFVFDHPVWFQKHLLKTPERFCVLTLDYTYVDYLKKYYKVNAKFLPPAGEARPELFVVKKEYEVAFLGTYGAFYENVISSIQKSENKFILNRFLRYMKNNTQWTAEQAMIASLNDYQIAADEKKVRELIFEGRWCIHAVFQYYRKKVVKELLDSEITLHVYGASWEKSPFVEYDNLIIHGEKRGTDAAKEIAKAKISLNVMAWHKDSFTERIAESMLVKTAVLSDTSKYLEQQFEDEENILLFSLKNIKGLGVRVKQQLAQPEKLKEIAENAYQKACREHTWDKRAEAFLEKLEKTTGQ